MGTKEKYDLIFSIGEACSCTQALRMNKLQNYSYENILGGELWQIIQKI